MSKLTFLSWMQSIRFFFLCKFLKDLSTIKRKTSIPREATFAAQASLILTGPQTVKGKHRGRPHLPESSIIEQSFILGFPATNNEAEFEAVIAGLRMAAALRIIRLEVCCDSTLVVYQVNGKYTTKDEWMEASCNSSSA